VIVTNCSQLVTLAGPARVRRGAEMRDLGIIKDGAMLVRDRRIQAVAARAEIERQATPDDEVVDAHGRIVMPGFIDAHTHPVFAGTRADEFEQRIEGATYAEIAGRGGGIRSTVRKTREADEAGLLDTARRYREWFLRGGTTMIEAKSGYGLSPESELKILRVIRTLDSEGVLRYVPTFLGAHETPDEYRDRKGKYLDIVMHEMLPHVAAERLAEYCDIFCEPNVFPAPLAREFLSVAQAQGFGLRIHADQFSTDEGSMLAAQLRAVTADHLEGTSDRGLEALLAADVQPVLVPASVFHLGSNRYAPARRMIELGLGVVLATDFNPGSSPTASMPLVLWIACTAMRMTPAEAITAATINAAYSLGRGSNFGSLEAGKFADFVVHDCENYRELPYFFGRETARAVFVGGCRVLG
jgi:imidazolonepropionase